LHHCPLVLYSKAPQSNDCVNEKGRVAKMALFTHFTKATASGVANVASPSHSYMATANRAAKRTAWYSAFGAAATWSLIS
jgi:hypothetical protein